MGKRKTKAEKSKKMQSAFDPTGSWTGNYLLGYYEEPVQDVDDLQPIIGRPAVAKLLIGDTTK